MTVANDSKYSRKIENKGAFQNMTIYVYNYWIRDLFMIFWEIKN